MEVNEFKKLLVKKISDNNKVKGIAQTGDISAPLVAGQSDIDLFVICQEVPSTDERIEMYKSLGDVASDVQMNVSNGGIWGYGDIFMINGIDVMPMYFTVHEMKDYVEEVLSGKHLNREGRFYPVGRLASIESINILFEDRDEWTTIINRVKEYPSDYFEKWYKEQVWQILDEEDLGRVLLRKEVLFYHQVLEESIDHMLQALYAANCRYFPSRKRTERDIVAFRLIPDDFIKRLRKIMCDAVSENTIEESVSELKKLGREIQELVC
ncbi:MAG: DUF4037 domain-containing protein [Lachnospiraceae bacterium]|nr:DUF4037 domain-containing protein [Lachnospiraceae bacterium]